MNPCEEHLRHTLLAYAAELSARHEPPPAPLVFLRAERRARRLALHRAERPVRIMQMVSLVAAALACLVLLGFTRPTTHQLELGIPALLLVLAGAGTLLHAGRRLA